MPQKRKPTPRQIKAAQLMAENGRKSKPVSTGEIMKQAGYSPSVIEKPSKVTDSPVFQELLDQYIPDVNLAQVHARILNTRKLEHMMFPLEHGDPDDMHNPLPVDEELREYEIDNQKRIIDNLSDEDIINMLAEVNCTTKKIIHGEQARHVYFWAHDAAAQTKALELAYRMKGHLSKEGNGGNQFNFNFGASEQSFVKKVES